MQQDYVDNVKQLISASPGWRQVESCLNEHGGIDHYPRQIEAWANVKRKWSRELSSTQNAVEYVVLPVVRISDDDAQLTVFDADGEASFENSYYTILEPGQEEVPHERVVMLFKLLTDKNFRLDKTLLVT
jgi:hypothetical protein